jgi:hypothetical protein
MDAAFAASTTEVFIKGVVEGVYCTEIGEVAYQAACWRNREFGKVSA